MQVVRINRIIYNIKKLDDPICEIIINFHADEKTKTSIPKHSKKHIIKEENVDFENDEIKIDSLNSSKGILKIYININGEKVKSDDENKPNYYTILLKDIEIKDEFQDLDFNIVNNIKINLSMKVKNIIAGRGLASRMNMFNKKNENNTTNNIISTGSKTSVKDRVNFLKNLKMSLPPPEPKNNNIPNKLKLPTELTNKLMNRHSFIPNVNQNNEVKNQEIEENKKKDNIKNENENKEKEKSNENVNSPNKENNNEENEINNNINNNGHEKDDGNNKEKDKQDKHKEEKQNINDNKDIAINEIEKESKEEQNEIKQEIPQENKGGEQEKIKEEKKEEEQIEEEREEEEKKEDEGKEEERKEEEKKVDKQIEEEREEEERKEDEGKEEERKEEEKKEEEQIEDGRKEEEQKEEEKK